MARNISFSKRRRTVKIKNGIDTKEAVDTIGSSRKMPNTKAAQTINNDNKIVVISPYTIGNVLSLALESPSISGRFVRSATDEKQSKYGIIDFNRDIFRNIVLLPNPLFITRCQPTINNRTPEIEFASHPKIGFCFQLKGC